MTPETKGFPGPVGINDQGKVLQGNDVPDDRKMMEERDTEQASDEERRRLNEKQQKEQEEKLNEELIDMVLKLQDMEKQREAGAILHVKLQQELKEIKNKFLQAKLDATETRGKPKTYVEKMKEVEKISTARDEQWVVLIYALSERDKTKEEIMEAEKFFINKYVEKVRRTEDLMAHVKEEEEYIQRKLKEINEDIKESEESSAKSDEENQQKEKLQTMLGDLTAEKNAIEQKKQALLMEQLITNTQMNQVKQIELEVVENVSAETVKSRTSELNELEIRIENTHNVKQGYTDEVNRENKKINRLKRSNPKEALKMKKVLDLAKIKEKDVDLMLNTMLEDKEVLINKLNVLTGVETRNQLKELREIVKQEALKLEKDFQKITSDTALDTEKTLFRLVQDKIATQGAFAGMQGLSQNISAAKSDTDKAIKLIKALDEKIADPETDSKEIDQLKTLRESKILKQLNVVQEQRERIQKFKEIEIHLQNVLKVETTEDQKLESTKRNDEFNGILVNIPEFIKKYVEEEKIFPNLRKEGNEALKRLITKMFDESNTEDVINEILEDTKLSYENGGKYRNLILRQELPIYDRFEALFKLRDIAKIDKEARKVRSKEIGSSGENLATFQRRLALEAEQNKEASKERRRIQRENEAEKKQNKEWTQQNREEKERAKSRKEKEREQAKIEREKEQRAAEIKEALKQEFLKFQAFVPDYEDLVERTVAGNKQNEANNIEQKKARELKQQEAHERDQADKEMQDKPVDLNEYNLTFRSIKYTLWEKVLRKEGIKHKIRRGGDHHVLTKKIDGVVKQMRMPALPGTTINFEYINTMNMTFGISRRTLTGLLNVQISEINKPLLTPVEEQASASAPHSNPQKTDKETKTQQQKTDKEDTDQASGGKPKEQSSVNKNSSAVIYQVGTDNIITEATQYLSNRLKLKHGEENVVVVTKNKEGLLKIQGDTNKLKPGYKVKITGHVKGIGDKATMEGNTSEQLSEDLVTILPKGNSPRKVSVVGCGSGKCDENNNSFASNLEKNLQKKDVITTVKGYSKDISMSVKGKVLQGEQAPADKRMMEEGDIGDTEQASDEERKRLDKKKQQEETTTKEQEKFDKELIDIALKLQKLEERREATEILYKELHQKLQEAEGELLQADLDEIAALGISSEHRKKTAEVIRISKAIKELLVESEAVSSKRKEIGIETKDTEFLFLDKYIEKLERVQSLIINAEEETINIQGKLEKVNNAIKESKESPVESGEENPQKEKLQTTLDQLTAEKNAIEQEIHALSIERLAVEMTMNQDQQVRTEAIVSMSEEEVKRINSRLKVLETKLKATHNLKQGYVSRISAVNKAITKLRSQSLQGKGKSRYARAQLERNNKDLDLAKSQAKKIDKIFDSLLDDKESLTEELEVTIGFIDQEGSDKELEKFKQEALKLEKDFQEIRGNKAQDTEDTLSKKAQKAIITQGAIAGMNNLTQSIASAKVSREKILKFIAVSDEKIKSLEEGPKLEETKKTRKMMIVRQLNADQEQRERIKELRNIREYLENHTTTKLSDNEALNKDFDQILQDSADFTKTYIKSKEIVPNLRDKGTEALGRLVAEDFETNTIEKINILFDQALLNATAQDWYRKMLLNKTLPIYKRLEIFSDLEEEAAKASLNREKRAKRRNGIGLTINELRVKKEQEEVLKQQERETRRIVKDAKEQKQEEARNRIVEENKKIRDERIAAKNAALFELRAKEDANAKLRQEKEQAYKEEQKERKRVQLEISKKLNEAEKERQNQPVDLSKYNLTYRQVKYGNWRRALNQEVIEIRYARGSHHSVRKEVEGKLVVITLDLKAGNEIKASAIENMNLKFQLNRGTLEALGVIINEIRTPNNEDTDQASGGKPKEQSSVNKNSSAVIYQVGTDNIITEATQYLSNRLKLKHGEENVVVVTKNKEGLLKIQGDTSKLKPGYKVKITGHVKGIGDKATMEGNTSEQLSEDLVTILPKGNSPRKVSVVGCGSGKCDENNNSFASNLEKNLQKKDVITTVKGYSKDISMSVKGKVLQGEQAFADKRMMEEGDTGDTAEQEKAELEVEGIRLKKEQEKAELEAEGIRLKNEEEKIRNEQVEDRKALRLLEAELEKTRSKRLEDHRLLYKSIETLSKIDEDMLDTDINIKMLDAAKEFEASGKSRNYFAQQDILRQKTAQKIAVQRETEIVNTEKVITLDQQLSDKFNELMIKRVQLRGAIHKEAENTQKKLEKVREDIKKEEKQTQGLSAESDKTNKEKLKETLHALEKEMEAIEQKRQALMKENLLIQMMDAQRTHVNDELIKILFEETKKYREEEVKKWTDKKNALSKVYLRAPTKGRSNKVKKLERDILHEENMLRRLKGRSQRMLNNLKDMLKKEQRKLASKEDMELGIKFISDLIDTATRGVRKLAIEEIEEKTNQIKNKESVLTKQNKKMDDLEKDFQSITANKEAQNTDHDNNTLREVAQQAIMRQEENEAIDELLEDISTAEKNKAIALKTIKKYDEEIAKSNTEEASNILKQERERPVILQLNADQEQYERIQTIKELKESLKEPLTVEGFSFPERKSKPEEEKRLEAIEKANSEFAQHYIKKEGILPDLSAQDMQLDALKRLAITEFEEKYTEAAVDKILEEIWISSASKELYKDQILNTDSDISNRLDVISWVKKLLERTVAFRQERAEERGVGPRDLERKKILKERILQDKIEREEHNKAAAARQQMRQAFKEEKKRLAQEGKKIAQDEERLAKEERLAQEKEALAQKEEASVQERERLAQEERILKVKQLETTEEQEERARATREDVGATLMEQYKIKDQEYIKKRNEGWIEKQQQAQENILAEEEELNQPVNFEKYKLEYNNIKVKTFKQAMVRAKIPMSYGGKHAVYYRIVDGKKSSYTMSLHSGTLIAAVYIKILQDELKLNMRTMKSLGVVFRPLTSGSAKKQASASSDLQKTHRKTKIQQKTNDKDGDQASGGKPKEQPPTKQDDSVNPAIKHNSSLIVQIANDQTANDMQKKITAKQNKQYTTDKVVVVKKNKGKLAITQGQARNLTGNLEVQVIGRGEQVDGINKLEGLDSGEVVEIIQRFIPQTAKLTTVFLMSCYSDSCFNGQLSLVQEVKARFEHFVDVVGYKGRVNVDNDGNPEIVTDDRPGMAPSDINSLKQKADELDQQLEKLTDKMEEIITAQNQALDNIEPQTQAANATNAEVIKIKKEVEQAQDNLIQAQQTVVTLEKKIQSNNQAIKQETQAEETAKQVIQKEQEKQAKTSNEIKQKQAENKAAIKEKNDTEKSLKKLQNTQRSHKPAKKATKEEDQIAKNILVAKINEARRLDSEKKRIVKDTTDALTTENQQLQEIEKTIETANKALIQAQQNRQQQTTSRQQTQQEQSSASQLLEEATQTVTQLKTQEATATAENEIAQDTLRTAQKEQGIEDREEIRNTRQQLEEASNNMSEIGAQIRQHEHNAVYEEKAKEAEADNIVNYEEDTLQQNFLKLNKNIKAAMGKHEILQSKVSDLRHKKQNKLQNKKEEEIHQTKEIEGVGALTSTRSESNKETKIKQVKTPLKNTGDDKKDINTIDRPSDQVPQQNNSRLQDNIDTSNKGNKPKATSQRGPPTDTESLQSKDISIKSDEEKTEESLKTPASSQQKMTTEQEPSSSPIHASKQSQKLPTTTSQQTKAKSINKSEEQSKTLEKKDPLSLLKSEESNKKETTNRGASSEDTKSQQQAGTLEALQNKSSSKPNNQTLNKKDGSVAVYKVGTNTPIKPESHVIIQKTDDSITDNASKNLVNKLNKQHGAENVVVIKETKNKKHLKIQGNIENIKGNYQVQIIGHGTEEDGVRKLNKKTGKTIAEKLKQLTSTIHDTQAQLTKVLILSCDGDTCGTKGTSLVQDISQVLNNVKVEGYNSRVNVRTDGSIKENVPEGEDALGGFSSKQKKSENKSNQEAVYDNKINAKTDDSTKENAPKEEGTLSNPNSKQEKNESNQEKTTDIEPQQQSSTSGIPQRLRKKVKTISWDQGVSELRSGMRNGWLKDLWIGETHDNASGKKLFIDVFIDVIEIFNTILEDVSSRPKHGKVYGFTDNVEELRGFFSTMFPNLDKKNIDELAEVSSSMYKLINSKGTFLIARDAWNDHVQERKEMQLDGGGETIILVGAKHVLSHKVDKLYPTFNANAYPAYQYFNADKSIALVPEQSIQYDRAFDRGNKDAAPEYAVWVKSKDKSMKNPALFVGQKTAMEKLFGDKISLLPKSLLDLDPPTKYESHIVIQESDDKIADIIREKQVEKLHKKHNKEAVLVIKKIQNGDPVTLQGSIQNVKGEYKVQIIGHGYKDEHGIEKLAGKDGKQIAQGLKALEALILDNPYAKLANVLLLNCCGTTSGTWGANLAEDFKKALNNESVKIKSYNNIDSERQEKTVLNEELSQDNKAPIDTKPQQQPDTYKNTSSTKQNTQDLTPPHNLTHPKSKYDSSLIIQMANDQTANDIQKKITTKQIQQHATEKVVVIKKNNGKLEVIQGQVSDLTGNLKVQVIGHGKQVEGVNTLEGRDSKGVVGIIKKFLPQTVESAKLFLLSCYSGRCLNGQLSLAQEVQTLFGKLFDVVGYEGRVNVDKSGNPKIVGDDEPGMAPENNTDVLEQAFKDSKALLDDQVDELTKLKEKEQQALANIEPETLAEKVTRDEVLQITKELEPVQEELRQAQEKEEAANKKIQNNHKEYQELKQTANDLTQTIQAAEEEKAQVAEEVKQKQGANETAKNAKDKSDKEASRLNRLHRTKINKKTTKKASTGASADELEVLSSKLKAARDVVKIDRQNAAGTEKEFNEANEKLQKITATVDNENKNLDQVNKKIQQKQVEKQQAEHEQESAYQVVLDKTQGVKDLGEKHSVLTKKYEIRQQALEEARAIQGVRSIKDKIRELREGMEKTSDELFRLNQKMDKAEQLIIHKQKEEKAKLDDIVDYENDTFQGRSVVKSDAVIRFLSRYNIKIAFSGSHAKAVLTDPDTQEKIVFSAGPLIGKAHINVLLADLINIAKHLKLSKSILREQFNIIVKSNKTIPTASLEESPTSNKEIVLVQMGSNEEVVSTRKRTVEQIKQDSNAPSKIYVVKEDDEGMQHSVEGNIKELTGEYEVNIIGRSTIKNGVRVIEGRNAKKLTDILTKIAPIEQGAGSVDTPILKKIKITHCKGSDCNAINNLASSLRKKTGGDIPVEDSLEHRYNKNLAQFEARQKKESENQKQQQKEDKEHEERANEWGNSFEWKTNDRQQSEGFILEKQRLKQSSERDQERKAHKHKEELGRTANAEHTDIVVANVIQELLNKKEEEKKRKRAESQVTKQKAVEFIMKDIETLVDLPDDLSNRLKKHLMRDEAKILNIEPSESKPKQTRSYKTKEGAKQIDINKEIEDLELKIVQSLDIDEKTIHNMKVIATSAEFIDTREQLVIGKWLTHKKAQAEALELADQLHEIDPTKGSAEDILTNLATIKFTESILKMRELYDHGVDVMEINDNFIRSSETNIIMILTDMNILEKVMEAKSLASIAEIQRILMPQEDFDSIKAQQEKFKMMQETVKKVKGGFYQNIFRLEEIIEFITKMKVSLKVINDIKELRDKIAVRMEMLSPASPTLDKMQSILETNVEKIQSDASTLVRSDIEKGITPKQENPKTPSIKDNEKILSWISMLKLLASDMEELHNSFKSRNSIIYQVPSLSSWRDDITNDYNRFSKRHLGYTRQLDQDASVFNEILDEDKRKQEISHMYGGFRKQTQGLKKIWNEMREKIGIYEAMLKKQDKVVRNRGAKRK